MMDYTQPPAYVQAADPAQICIGQLHKLISPHLTEQQKAGLQFAFPIDSLEGKLSAFPPKGARLIPNLENGVHGIHDGTYRFYRYAGSEREWDIALGVDERGIPITLYHSIGNPIERFGMVIPADVIFNFYDNPLKPLNPNFDIQALKIYISNANLLCKIALRQAFDRAYYNAKNKEKPKIQPGPIPPKERAETPRLNPQVSLRQKVIR